MMKKNDCTIGLISNIIQIKIEDMIYTIDFDSIETAKKWYDAALKTLKSPLKKSTYEKLMMGSNKQIGEGYIIEGTDIFIERHKDGSRIYWTSAGQSNGMIINGKYYQNRQLAIYGAIANILQAYEQDLYIPSSRGIVLNTHNTILLNIYQSQKHNLIELFHEKGLNLLKIYQLSYGELLQAKAEEPIASDYTTLKLYINKLFVLNREVIDNIEKFKEEA